MLEQELIGLGILFFFVIIGGIIAARIKQPIGIGLLLIGALIGPSAFNLVKDHFIIDAMVEIGAILLLFVIGLEFVIPKLARIGFKAIMIGLTKIGIILFMSYEVLIFLGQSPLVALIFGIVLSISSTVVIVKVLEAKGLYQREEMPLLIGVLIIEDIISVIVLTFINKAMSDGSAITIVENIIIAITILCVAYFVMLKISKFIVSWFIKNSGDEIITFIALGLCVGFSYLSYALGLSPATGAFLAGSIVASLSEVKLFEHAIKPYSNLFACLFFIAIGTKVNFMNLQSNLAILGILLALIIFSRFVAVGLIGYLFASFRKDQPVFSSIAMITISEFSLLIAQAAMQLNLGVDFVSITASLIFITACIMSFSIGYCDKVQNLLQTAAPRDWGAKPKSFSNYIKLLFAELDIENMHTKSFKKSCFEIMRNMLFILFIIIGGQKLYTIFVENNFPAWTYLLYILLMGLIGFLLYLTYRDVKKARNVLISILINGDSTVSPQRSKYVLNNLIVTSILFSIAIYSPAIMVFMKMNVWANLIPFFLLLVAVVRLKKVVRVIHRTGYKPSIFAD